MSEEKKFNAIDLGKFIASFLVIAIHTHPLYGVENLFIQRIFEVITSLAVPFFFLCSSFFLFLNSNMEEYGRKIYKFVRYYVIWSIVYIPLTIYGIIIDEATISRKIFLLFRGYFFVGENYYSWSLWYLLALIYGFYGICYLISKQISNKTIGICSVVVYFISCIMDYLVVNCDDLSTVMRIGARLVRGSFVNGRLFTAPLYIFIGYMLSLLYSRISIINSSIKRIATLLIIVSGVLRCIGHNLWLDNCLKVVMAACVFVVLIFIQLPNSVWFSRFRKFSIVTYFVHLYVFFGIQRFFGQKNFGIAAFMWTAVISLIIGYLVLCFEKNNKLLKKLF